MVGQHGGEHGVDLERGLATVGDPLARGGDRPEHVDVHQVVPRGVGVEQRGVLLDARLLAGGGPVHQQHRHPLDERTGNGVEQCERADAVRGVDAAEAAEAGVGIGGVAGADLVRVARDGDRRMGVGEDRVEERRGVVPRDAEHAIQAELLEPRLQVARDGGWGRGGRRRRGWRRGRLGRCIRGRARHPGARHFRSKYVRRVANRLTAPMRSRCVSASNSGSTYSRMLARTRSP